MCGIVNQWSRRGTEKGIVGLQAELRFWSQT